LTYEISQYRNRVRIGLHRNRIRRSSRSDLIEVGCLPTISADEAESAAQNFEQGRHVLRFDTFGDQSFWGDALKLHQAIEGSKLGGVGPGVSPNTALAVGLKVDADGQDKADLVEFLKSLPGVRMD
jgi:hypothetical protein